MAETRGEAKEAGPAMEQPKPISKQEFISIIETSLQKIVPDEISFRDAKLFMEQFASFCRAYLNAGEKE